MKENISARRKTLKPEWSYGLFKQTKFFVGAALALLLWLTPLIARAQTPFTTDDAEVTDKGKFHFEFLNEYDSLQKSLHPSLRQDAATSRFAYGLVKNVEIGVDVPIVTIFNARGTVPQRSFGLSDTSFHVKAKLLEE